MVLSDRLQDAIASEIEFSAAMIGAGFPLTLRALILGSNTNCRLPLDGIPICDDRTEYGNAVMTILRVAMLFAVGRAFVLTIPDPIQGTFTTHGVSEHADVAFHSPMAAPFDPAGVSRRDCPEDVSAAMRDCIPKAPAIIPFDLVEVSNQAFQPGGTYELLRVGPHLNPFQFSEGRA